MFAKRFLHRADHHPQKSMQQNSLKETDLDVQITAHYGIPSTSSLLAYDPIQCLLAIGTLDGRVKLIGGDGIEGLLISPKQLPLKFIEFLQNQGYLVTILNDNDIQVWNLENRCLVCSLQWDSNITSFSAIHGSNFIYVGDEHGLMSVMKYNVEEGRILRLPYNISSNTLSEASECQFPSDEPIVGVLPQPYSSGNRVLIAYQNGLIALWDVSAARIIFSGGGTDLHLKEEIVEASSEANVTLLEDEATEHMGEKEISALCWASSTGSVLAVGYVDGDILFWETSSAASNKGQQAISASNSVVKLRLSSAERRLPVIVLQWSATKKMRNDCDGKLFIYGGDEIGSDEVLTVLSLEWSSGMDGLKCIGRTDITLTGSFADMILLPSAGPMGSDKKADVFVLTCPGELHFYDDAIIASLLTHQERKLSLNSIEFPTVIPMNDPTMTAAKFIKLPAGESSLSTLLDVISKMNTGSMPTSAGRTKWPLTGGVPSQLSIAKDRKTERLYFAGYTDGSVRIWDATFPVFSSICHLEGQVQEIKVLGSTAPVSELDFCFLTLSLAIGNECGLIRIYDLKGCPDGTNFQFVKETKTEVHRLSQQKGLHCSAVFSLVNSPVQKLQFMHSGAKLAAGFKCGRVAVFDMTSLSVAYFLNDVSCSDSPVISIIWKEDASNSLAKSLKQPHAHATENSTNEVMFVLTRDAKIIVLDGHSGNMVTARTWHLKKDSTAVSLYVIEGDNAPKASDGKHLDDSSDDNIIFEEPVSDSISGGKSSHASEQYSSSDATYSDGILLNSLVLLCCEDSSCLFSTKAVIEGNDKPIHKVNHAKHCVWATTFIKEKKVKGLVLLFQTGAIEIRSLPDLELVKETSLMSILRWNIKANMNRMLSASSNGQIMMANGSEVALISLLASDDAFRIRESLPCLHDKLVAAAADAALGVSTNQKKKQVIPPAILGGILKGLRGVNNDPSLDFTRTPKATLTHLEELFSRASYLDPSLHVNLQEVAELDIDDIKIDDAPLMVASTSDTKNTEKDKEKGSDRERLFEGGSLDDLKPRVRSREEIMAAYGKAKDASSAAADSRNKLVERQEKLERMNQRTAELQNGAEDFASMANELVKKLDNRKWWQI